MKAARSATSVLHCRHTVPPEKVEVVFAGTDVELFDPAKWDPRAFRREKGPPGGGGGLPPGLDG